MARQTREEREQEVRKQYEAVTDRLYTDRHSRIFFLFQASTISSRQSIQ